MKVNHIERIAVLTRVATSLRRLRMTVLRKENGAGATEEGTSEREANEEDRRDE